MGKKKKKRGGGGGGGQHQEHEQASTHAEERGEQAVADAEHEKEGKEQDDKGGGNAGKGKSGKDNKKPAVPVVGTVVLKIKGVEQVRMEMTKNQVTVTGTMDVKALPEKLRKKLRRPVDVVPPNNKQQQYGTKDKDGKQGDGKDKALAAEVELSKSAFYDQQALQATEFMLSDENPNA